MVRGLDRGERELYNDVKKKVISFQFNYGKGALDQLPPDTRVSATSWPKCW